MKTNNTLVLLRTMLTAYSPLNTLRYSNDKKKKSTIIGNTIGIAILYVFIMAYCVLMCIGYREIGIEETIPGMCALLISVLAFLFTLLKASGYLFSFKEYDMLMSMPFDVKTIVADKFLYMYIKSLPWYISISVAMLVGFGLTGGASVMTYPVWIILSLIIPIIPMVVASIISSFIAKAGSGFKNKKLVQMILVFVFVIFCFSLRFIIEGIFKNNQVEEVLETLASANGSISKYYLPVGWFKNAVTEGKASDGLLLIASSILIFVLFFVILSKSYRRINSKLSESVSKKDYKVKELKTRSVVNTIAFKEFKRMLGSVTYMTNAGLGEVMVALIGIAALFVDGQKIVGVLTNGAPVSADVVAPVIPFIVYFFLGMVATTAITPSLEGKNYWIVKSLPIKPETLYKGKMLFNLYLTVPFAIFGTLALSFSFRVDIISALLYVICAVTLCVFSTVLGTIEGIKHINLDWDNEIQVVKQGAAVGLYLLPNMIFTFVAAAGVIVLGLIINQKIVILLITVLTALVTLLLYTRIKSVIKKHNP